MAVRIPTYEAQLLPTGTLQARAAGVPVSDAVGRALQGFGDTVGGIETRIMRDINEGKVRDADNQASDAIRGLLYDPNSGYLTRRGKDAIDGYADIQDKIRKIQDDVSGELGNHAQRKMFSEIMGRRVQAALGNVASHAAVETQNYNTTQAAARADRATADAIANYGDPAQYNTFRNTMLQEAAYGKTGDVAEQAQRQALSTMHVGVINQMVSQDRAPLAKEWFKQHEGEIDPRVTDRLRTQLDAAGVKDKSLQLQMAMAALPYQQQVKQLETLRKDGKISVEEYDATRQRIDHEESVRRVQEDTNDRANLGAAYDWLLKNPGKSVLDLPNGLYLWAKSRGAPLAALKSFAENGGNPTTDSEVYYTLRQAAADKPNEFANANLMQYRDRLSNTDFKGLVDIQSAIRSNDVKKMQLSDQASHAVSQLGAELSAAHIDTSPKPGDTKMANYKAALIRAIDARQSLKQAPLTSDEVRNIGLDLLKPGRLQGSGIVWDTGKLRYEVTPEEQAKTPFVEAKYDYIPATRRAKFEKYLSNPAIAQRWGLQPARDKGSKRWKEVIEIMYQQANDAGVEW